MSCGQGFVNWSNVLRCVGLSALSMPVMMGTFRGLLFLAKLDRTTSEEGTPEMFRRAKEKFPHRVIGVGNAVGVCCVYGIIYKTDIYKADTGKLLWMMFFLSAFAGVLLTACIMDVRSCYVYNYVWWVGSVAGIGMLCTHLHDIGICNQPIFIDTVRELLFSIVIFVLLQELFFSRFYGRADCHAFAVCALVEGALGLQMKEFLLHMLFAFGLLAVVQLVHRNVGEDGNLKKPVPFLPYITISFWGILLL